MNAPVPPPLVHFTNLGRLGNAGDVVEFSADPAQLGALARWSGVVDVTDFRVRADLARLGPTRFQVDYRLTADVVQACVVTLEPVSAHLEQHFVRELRFVDSHGREPGPQAVDAMGEDGPEEIDSLHYDLAGPALEEYVLALDPYPRRPGVAFAAGGDPDMPGENPFAALKVLKGKNRP